MSSYDVLASRRYVEACELAEDFGFDQDTVEALTIEQFYARIESYGWFWSGDAWVPVSQSVLHPDKAGHRRLSISSENALAAERYSQARELAEDLGFSQTAIESLSREELYAQIESSGWFWTGETWTTGSPPGAYPRQTPQAGAT